MAAFVPPFRITLLIAHGRVSPVTASSAAMPRPGLVDPLVEVKEPATTTLDSSGETTTERAPYPPARTGLKASSAPEAALSAAIPARGVPPMLLNSPTT